MSLNVFKKRTKLKTFRFGLMGVYSIQGKTLAFSRAVLNVFFSDAQWKPIIYVIQIYLVNFFSTQIFFQLRPQSVVLFFGRVVLIFLYCGYYFFLLGELFLVADFFPDVVRKVFFCRMVLFFSDFYFDLTNFSRRRFLFFDVGHNVFFAE